MHDDDLIPFGKLPKLIPGRPNLSTLHRWRQRGIRGVRLDVEYRGGRVFVTREALQRFFEGVKAAREGCTLQPRTNKQRRRAIDAAERELAAEGI